jgi:uncharacterized metal-binding protein
MPSGRTHDTFSYVLVIPSFLCFRWYWGGFVVALVATIGMLFAGLMFGPDLDIHSSQYKRWGPARFIWAPYRMAISHRSRLSHGLLLSTLLRVAYFLAVVLLLSTCVFYVRHHYLFGLETSWTAEFQKVSDDFMTLWNRTDKQYFKAIFAGLWVGAAVHTIIDVSNSIARLLWKAL